MSEQTYCNRIVLNQKVELHSFDTFDGKGREFGALVNRFAATFTLNSERYGYRMAPGDYFGASVQQARNGKSYGASQPDHYFATAEEREKWIEKRVNDTHRRTSKIIDV